jgi:ABC-2 type transport system ATP-binding protein
MVTSATTNVSPDTPAVELCGLRKRYGQHVALDGLDLEVPQGAFFGLLGPNGAGKTTTVGILTTLLEPSGGSAKLLGRDVVAERARVRREVGVVFQESTLDPELTAREHLRLYARLYRLPRPRERADALLELLSLSDDADRLTRELSGGMRRRLEIARGILHEPRVLFLDEPTIGLDVAARARLWRHLRDLRESGGTTIVLTTHSMEEADALCDTLAIVDGGRAVTSGAPEALKAALGGDVVRLVVRDGAQLRDRLEAVPGVTRVDEESAAEGSAFRITVAEGPRRLAELVDVGRPSGIEEVTLQRPSLDHVFLHHTGHRFEERDA